MPAKIIAPHDVGGAVVIEIANSGHSPARHIVVEGKARTAK